MSEISKIFEGLEKKFVKGNHKEPRTYYFSLDDDEKWTVAMGPSGCKVTAGHTDNADCFFKGTKEMFLEVWNGRYTPSAMDFLTGKIKSNNPVLLKDFIAAFKAKGA